MSWIQTYSGKCFDFINPRLEDITITDIAHSLSMQCRFNGHCQRFYSVAEHSYWASIRAADIASALVKAGTINREHGVAITKTALLHDAGEAYIGDMVKPLKSLLGMEKFSDVEFKIVNRIYEKFKFPVDKIALSVTKQADLEMLAIEQTKVMGTCTRQWCDMVPVPSPNFVEIEFWNPDMAKIRFLSAAHSLGIDA
ncbi:MAG: HD domain-containing protein [Patescibacteria group bacterium]